MALYVEIVVGIIIVNFYQGNPWWLKNYKKLYKFLVVHPTLAGRRQ